MASYIGVNTLFEKAYLDGTIHLELVPQGNLAERIRAGGAGIPAFYTPTGVGTWLEEGKIPARLTDHGKTVVETVAKRESREFKGKRYQLEEAITGDFAFVKVKIQILM